MKAKLPGPRLHRWLASSVDRDTFARLIEPTLADLQHEASAAPTTWARVSAICAGYRALARILVVCEVTAPGAWARAGAILTLGAIGAALEQRALATAMDACVVNSALLLPTFAAPMIFRLLDRKSGYWRLFVISATAGMVPWLAHEVVIARAYPTAFVWLVIRLANGSAFTAIASALGAAAVWSPADDAAPLPRRVLTGLWFGSAATTTVFLARNLAQSTDTLTLAALRAPFFVMLFALILAVTVLPPLLLARRWIRRRAWITLFAVACFPIPILVSAVIDGPNVHQSIPDCLHWSLPALLSSLPFIAGATTLGWVLGTRRLSHSHRLVTT